MFDALSSFLKKLIMVAKDITTCAKILVNNSDISYF